MSVAGADFEALFELRRDGVLTVETFAERRGLQPDETDSVLTDLVAQGIVERREGDLELTARGLELSTAVVRRHALVERLLLDVIGLEWSKVHHEAERWDGVISSDVEHKLVDLLGDPGTCAHGNPVPGSANAPDYSAAVTVDRAPIGPVRVVRVVEELEEDDDALALLEGSGFIPGRFGEIQGPSDGGVAVAGSSRDAVLPPHVAAGTYVVPR